MKGIIVYYLLTLAGAGLLILPAVSVHAFEFKRHNNKAVMFHDNFGQPAFSGDDPGAGRGVFPAMGQDRARRAVEQGEILPLSSIRRRVHEQFGGKIVGVDLAPSVEGAGQSAPWIYDIRVLSPEGRVLSVQMDASDGHVIDVRGQR